MNSRLLAVYGAGGFAREVAWLLESCAQAGQPVRCAGFIDDDPASHGTTLNGYPVRSLEQVAAEQLGIGVVLAVGNPKVRERLATRVLESGLTLGSLVHPRTEKSRWVTLDEGVVICAGSILTTNIQVGRGVQINLDCTVGHDVVLGAFTTLAPGVHVSGCVRFGRRVYVGTGAVLINGTPEEPLVIGDDAIVGAGACVVRSVAAGETVVGVPAKPRG